MLIMRNQGCIVAVTLGSDNPIWGPNPYSKLSHLLLEHVVCAII